jgi:GNAT superfamily N-acetyltransferase
MHEHPLYEYLRQELGADAVDSDAYPPDLLFADERCICLLVGEDDGVLILNEIECWPQQQGLGTALMEAVLRYCQTHSLQLKLRDVTAPCFFDRFPWLQAEATDEEHENRVIVDYWYRP